MFFCAGESDVFIQPKHSEILYNHWEGQKMFRLVPGDHSSERPAEVIAETIRFIQEIAVRQG